MNISVSKSYCDKSFLSRWWIIMRIILKQLITEGIWKFCVVGNLSHENHSISAPSFCCVIMWQDNEICKQLNVINNILLIECWGTKAVLYSVNFR